MSSPSRVFAALLVIFNIFFGNGAPPQKIIGGLLATREEFPYIVSLQKNNEHFCGGAIISEKHILTAAHCVEGIMIYPYSDISILSGTTNLILHKQNHTISKAIIHPDFVLSSKSSYPNDIAVLTLSEPIKFNKYQNKINLPTSDVEEDSEGIVAGWGSQADSFQKPSFLLMKITTKILKPEQCKYHIDNQLYFEQICGIYSKNQGTCRGDSGGPLNVNNVIVGVVSWGNKICAEGHPDIYTNVYLYIDFIQQQMD